MYKRKNVGDAFNNLAHNVGKNTTDVSLKAKNTVNKSQEAILNANDMN